MSQDEKAAPVERYVRKETPSVLASFKPLKRGTQVLHIRLMQYSKSPVVCDIREYIKTDDHNGFTKKGISLDLEQLRQLHADLPAIISALEDF